MEMSIDQLFVFSIILLPDFCAHVINCIYAYYPQAKCANLFICFLFSRISAEYESWI